MQDTRQYPRLPDGAIPLEQVRHYEKLWLSLMVSTLVLFMCVVVVTGITGSIQPPSHVETIDPTTLHLGGEFAESNLGTVVEPDGSVTARMIGTQYTFVPDCIAVPTGTTVRFRITSADVVHGFVLPYTNVNTMVVPGLIAEVRTQFSQPAVYSMPCNEFCGNGHHGMWTRVKVVPKQQFRPSAPNERPSCVQE